MIIADAATVDAEQAELIARAAAAAVDRPEQALLLALEAHRRVPGPATIGALLDTIASGALGRQVGAVRRLPDEGCGGLGSTRRNSSDGLWEFATVGTDLLRSDLVTGEVTNQGTAPATCTGWWEDRGTGMRWATTSSLNSHWIRSGESEWTTIDYRRVGGSLVPEYVNERFLFGQESFGSALAPATRGEVVVSAASLEEVAPAIPELDFDLDEPFPVAAAGQLDGLFAVGTDAPSGGIVVVLDAATGTEVFRVPRPKRVTALAFAQEDDILLVGDDSGNVATVGVASGVVITESEMSEPSEVIALGTRGDDVVAVSRRSIELFGPSGDRRRGAIDIIVADEARVRPDGTVVIVPGIDTDIVQFIDLDRGPLVERGWEVDPDALVGFGDGRATVVDASSSMEVVELSTGRRNGLELVTRDGESFDALAVTPEVGGYLAWTDGTLVARWRGGDIVEQVELWVGPNNVSQTRGQVLTGNPGWSNLSAGETGGGFAGAGAIAVFEHEQALAVYAFDPAPGSLALLSTLETPPFAMSVVAPAPEGGVYVAMNEGMLRRYDRAGTRVQEIDTGLANPSVTSTDPWTGSIALGGENGAVIVDPLTESVQSVTDVAAIASLGFARNGELLVVVESDGTVRLWDAARAEPVGTLWTGSGTAPASPPWYDESTDSVWVATSGKVLQFSLDPTRWVERVCGLVSRELTEGEWDRLVPGDEPQRPACR